MKTPPTDRPGDAQDTRRISGERPENHRVIPFRQRPALDADERTRLMTGYRGEWVAVRDSEVVASSGDLDELLAMIRSEPDSASLLIERLTDDT